MNVFSEASRVSTLVLRLVTLVTIVTLAASSCVTRSGDQGQCRRERDCEAVKQGR